MKAVHQAFATLACILAFSMAGCSLLDGESDAAIQKGASLEAASIEAASRRKIEEPTVVFVERWQNHDVCHGRIFPFGESD